MICLFAIFVLAWAALMAVVAWAMTEEEYEP